MCDTCQQLKAEAEAAYNAYMTDTEDDGDVLYDAWWAARERYAEHKATHET